MKNFIIIFCLFITSILYSQQNKNMSDDLFLELQNKTRDFFYENVDSAFYYIDKIEKSNNKIHIAFANGAKGFAFSLKGDYEKGIKCYLKGVDLIEKNTTTSKFKFEIEAFIHLYGGNIYFNKKKFSEALDAYFKSKFFFEKNNDEVLSNMISLNIANIYNEIGNYQKAIQVYSMVDHVIDNKKLSFTPTEYNSKKAFVNLNLGICYENYFSKDKSKMTLLDSAFYFYEKTLNLYSNDNLYFKMSSLKNLGNIYFYRNKFKEAEDSYLKAISLASQNDNIPIQYSSAYNLGLIYYEENDYNRAIHYLKKVDSLYYINNSLGLSEFVDSNFKQAKIYNSLKDYKTSLKYSTIFLENRDKINQLQSDNILDVNKKLNSIETKNEIKKIIQDNNKKIVMNKAFVYVFILIFILLIILLINRFYTKKRFKEKIEKLMKEYEESNSILQYEKNETATIINIDNENEILENFKVLIEKKEYLKSDFTQQTVAKKIKTNTTYLSNIVNKHYQKSFSNYLNELRINYVINEIITNSRYREYTTQAIAESAGFKNADSFTTSFKKKTGVTPFQFINEVKKRKET